jgi:hypothetical protein
MCQTPLKEPLSVRPSTDPVPKRGVCEIKKRSGKEVRKFTTEAVNKRREYAGKLC